MSEKSLRRNPAASTPAATRVEANAAIRAFRAEWASRRRLLEAAYAPATSAYRHRPSVTTSAARPSSAIYCAAGFVAEYFEGHFVTIVPGSATNVPFSSLPSITMSRPVANRSGTLPV